MHRKIITLPLAGLTILAVLLLFPFSIEAANFGNETDGASSSNDSSDNKWASQATPASSGTVTSLTARMAVSPSGSASIRGFIYSDSGGEPDALLAVTEDSFATGTTEAAYTMNFTGANQISIVAGTPYWIGLHWEDPGTSSVILSRSATANLRRTGNGDEFDDGPAATFGVTNTLSGPIDTYVTYTEGGGAAPAPEPVAVPHIITFE